MAPVEVMAASNATARSGKDFLLEASNVTSLFSSAAEQVYRRKLYETSCNAGQGHGESCSRYPGNSGQRCGDPDCTTCGYSYDNPTGGHRKCKNCCSQWGWCGGGTDHCISAQKAYTCADLCGDCEAGKYQDKDGHSGGCTPCEAGMYSLAGALSCNLGTLSTTATSNSYGVLVDTLVVKTTGWGNTQTNGHTIDGIYTKQSTRRNDKYEWRRNSPFMSIQWAPRTVTSYQNAWWFNTNTGHGAVAYLNGNVLSLGDPLDSGVRWKKGLKTGSNGHVIPSITISSCTCPANANKDENGLCKCQTGHKQMFSSTTNSEICQACPTGKFQESAAATAYSCKFCPQGQYAVSATVACKICETGKYQELSAATAYSCTTCSAGYSTPSATDSCERCSAGQFQNLAEATEYQCKSCSPGDYAAQTGQASCKKCPENNYQPKYGGDRCYQCLSAPTLPGAVECPGSCQVGTYKKIFFDNSTTCIDCAPGFYTSISDQEDACSACGEGQYTSSNTSDSCVNCPRGQYGDEKRGTSQQSACKICGRGKFNLNFGASGEDSCVKCAAGKWSAAESASTDSTCNSCLPGTWSDKTGASMNTSCIACKAGKQNVHINAKSEASCVSCEKGKYQNLEGQAFCLPCSLGFFNSKVARSKCDTCSPGMFTNTTGQLHCMSCSVGRHNDLSGSTLCMKCIPGYFQDEKGRSKCKDCPVSFFSKNPGQVKCDPPSFGQVVGVGGSSVVNVAKGWYSTGNVSSPTEPCKAGTYGEDPPTSQCT